MRLGLLNPRTAFAALPPKITLPGKNGGAGCERLLIFNTLIESIEMPVTLPFYGRC